MAKKRVTDELQMIKSFWNSFDVSNYLVGKQNICDATWGRPISTLCVMNWIVVIVNCIEFQRLG